jgi:hypothetical protein
MSKQGRELTQLLLYSTDCLQANNDLKMPSFGFGINFCFVPEARKVSGGPM